MYSNIYRPSLIYKLIYICVYGVLYMLIIIYGRSVYRHNETYSVEFENKKEWNEHQIFYKWLGNMNIIHIVKSTYVKYWKLPDLQQKITNVWLWLHTLNLKLTTRSKTYCTPHQQQLPLVGWLFGWLRRLIRLGFDH